MVLWAWMVYSFTLIVVGAAVEKHFELGDWWFPTWLVASMVIQHQMGKRIMFLHFDAPSVAQDSPAKPEAGKEGLRRVC